jgi:hypothetical protein
VLSVALQPVFLIILLLTALYGWPHMGLAIHGATP